MGADILTSASGHCRSVSIESISEISAAISWICEIRAEPPCNEPVTISLFHAIYSSTPFGYNFQTLAALLLDARRLNKRDSIKGALICRRDIYLQLLEEPEVAVRATLDRIKRDDRHVNLVLHVEASASERMFGEWDMLHDPAI
ncbi:BLUF domain-containing protein [Ahrensia sp. R2A130]|uniref:BLUF domain-containing protein n=1 Tax=Ahrensia sp. R2A130 TaxID=744979 RepID=UPI001B3B5900|nr:BLUF domain-containing protein [Ahrensia sp. R2A130]